MSYSLSILRRAQKELAQIPSGHYERLVDAIRDLADNPRPPGCRKLTGREGWRIRLEISGSSMKSMTANAR
jgi:mRNA interferase RelE/StbE